MCSNIHLSPASLCGHSGRDFGRFRFYYLPLKHRTCRRTELNRSALRPALLMGTLGSPAQEGLFFCIFHVQGSRFKM